MAGPLKTQFPRVGGQQRIDSFYRFGTPVGNVFYVSSTASTSTSTGPGYSPETAFTTIDAAIGACTANNGDVILVEPHHAETITAAAAIAVDVAGISIIGLGQGRARPVITFTTAVAASMDVSAANVLIKNIAFVCGIDNQTAMVNVTAADVAFEDCEFETNTGTVGAAIGILTAATATRFRVEGCYFHGPATNSGTTTTAQIDHEVGVDYIIRKNLFVGKCTQNITNGAAILRGFIDDNRFVTYTGTKSINMHASSTPFITNNRFNVPSGTAPVVAAAGFVAGNAYSAAAGVTAGAALTW